MPVRVLWSPVVYDCWRCLCMGTERVKRIKSIAHLNEVDWKEGKEGMCGWSESERNQRGDRRKQCLVCGGEEALRAFRWVFESLGSWFSFIKIQQKLLTVCLQNVNTQLELFWCWAPHLETHWMVYLWFLFCFFPGDFRKLCFRTWLKCEVYVLWGKKMSCSNPVGSELRNRFVMKNNNNNMTLQRRYLTWSCALLICVR